jgi:hypothetical protein
MRGEERFLSKLQPYNNGEKEKEAFVMGYF